ncbi:MAG: PglZ domain-containing protein, partial [Phaeodactylibacter sp.]|nr:PglZ domain-containing protein [Phaeodactylibacter sp.]
PHLKSHYGITDKVALLVVDGMAFWQYHLLKQSIADQGLTLEEHAIYSWIPSVTYLSRQAIFRGSTPSTDYVQSPANEKKLWEEYWKKEGLPPTMIRYDYQQVELNGLQNISRLAVVYTELDDKMHSSSDYEDLYALTQNWITRSQVSGQIHQLTREGFTVYLTTDHGNLEAAGWRNLKGKEKFGASKSRSKRHLEYAESWLADEFLSSNPELDEVVGREQNTLYLRDDRSFSNQATEVTHGGSHFLEVLIPFVKISSNGR